MKGISGLIKSMSTTKSESIHRFRVVNRRLILSSLIAVSSLVLFSSCSSCGGKKNDYSAQLRQWEEYQRHLNDSLMREANLDGNTHQIENMYFLINADDNAEILNSRIIYLGKDGKGTLTVFDPNGENEPAEVDITYTNDLDESNTITIYANNKGAYVLYVEEWTVPDTDFGFAYPKRVRMVATTTGAMSYGNRIGEEKVNSLLELSDHPTMTRELLVDDGDYESIEKLQQQIRSQREELDRITENASRSSKGKGQSAESTSSTSSNANKSASKSTSSSSASKTSAADGKKCQKCKGTGTCAYCRGRGKLKEADLKGNVQEVPCQMCHGHGKCSGCGGTGMAS